LAGKTPREAVHAFLDPLGRSLRQFTLTPLNVSGGYYVAAEPHALTLGDGGPVTLGGSSRLQISLSQRYRVIEAPEASGPWKVTTAGYFYAIADAEEREIVSFHWHPEGESYMVTPHIHLGPGAEVGHRSLADAHLPSGRVSIEQVLRLAVALGAEPLLEDWERELDRSQRLHEEWRQWG
jgi:hypothetical protein